MAIKSIIICATPRSGSTLLCDLMAATGQLGRPDSFFRRQSIGDFAAEFGVDSEARDFRTRYFEAAMVAGSDAQGLFGLRLMQDHLDELMQWLRPNASAEGDRDLLAAAFGAPLFVFLGRDDKLAQAVSRVRAEQSGLWHRHADGSVREQTGAPTCPHYDAAAIATYIAEAESDEALWQAWFARESITPHSIGYEALTSNPSEALAALLAATGRDPAAAAGIAPQTAKLADAESLEWITRYKRENGGA